MTCRGKANGFPMTSHRAESFGIWSLILKIRHQVRSQLASDRKQSASMYGILRSPMSVVFTRAGRQTTFATLSKSRKEEMEREIVERHTRSMRSHELQPRNKTFDRRWFILQIRWLRQLENPSSYSAKLQPLIEEQNNIGWDHLLGRFSLLWTTEQYRHL